jgi:tight adherence protein B
MMPMIIIAAIMGLAIALLFWGGRQWLLRRFASDVVWAQEVSMRFHPAPIQAQHWVLTAYLLLITVLGVLIFVTPHPLMAVGFWLVILLLPKMAVEILWQRRRRQIDQQIPAAVAAMANSLRAGLTLVQSMQRLADNAPEPIRTDFRVMVNRYACGANLEATIRETKQRLKLPNFNLFASALLINREMGGDIAATLLRISESLDKLQHMRQTVEAHTAEGRTNIKVLLVAPVLLLLMMSTADGEGVASLFTTVQGFAVLIVAGILIGMGVYFASWITHAEI